MNATPPLDLIIVVAGKDDRESLDGLLSSRRKSLGIRDIRYEILVHVRRDSGCFREAPALLQTFQRRASRALVVFDHEGSGQEARPAEEVTSDLRDRLRRSGWGDRAEVIIIRPELEVWVWSDSLHVDAVLGWKGRKPPLREWLRNHGLWPRDHLKPPDPRKSLLEALREAQMQKSSALYRRLAETVSLKYCQDEGFKRLKEILRSWFPEQEGS